MQSLENIYEFFVSNQLWPRFAGPVIVHGLPQGLHHIFAQTEFSLFSGLYATIVFFFPFPAVTSQPSAMFHRASTCQIMGFCDVCSAWLVCDHPNFKSSVSMRFGFLSFTVSCRLAPSSWIVMTPLPLGSKCITTEELSENLILSTKYELEATGQYAIC